MIKACSLGSSMLSRDAPVHKAAEKMLFNTNPLYLFPNKFKITKKKNIYMLTGLWRRIHFYSTMKVRVKPDFTARVLLYLS